MAVDVYFKQDILNVLRATYAAGEGPAAMLAEVLRDAELGDVPLDKLLRIYRMGFNTALGAVGLAFGLDAHPPERQIRPVSPCPAPRTRGDAVRGPSLGEGEADLDLAGLLWAASQIER